MIPWRDEYEPEDGHLDPEARAVYRRIRERLFTLPAARRAFCGLLLQRARAVESLLTPGERARTNAGETAFAYWRRELIPAQDACRYPDCDQHDCRWPDCQRTARLGLSRLANRDKGGRPSMGGDFTGHGPQHRRLLRRES